METDPVFNALPWVVQVILFVVILLVVGLRYALDILAALENFIHQWRTHRHERQRALRHDP